MSKIVDLIQQTQQAVADYEALPADQRTGEADEALMEGYTSVAPGDQFPDLLTFTGEVYYWIRRIEAVAYIRKRAGGIMENRAYGFVDWAWLWGDPIANRLRNEIPQLEPANELEEAGKLFIEEKLRWAMGRLNAFRDWGYSH